MSSTQDRLKHLASEHLGLGPDPDFDARLADAGINSMDAVAFFKEANKEFSLSLQPEDCLRFKSLNELLSFVNERSG